MHADDRPPARRGRALLLAVLLAACSAPAPEPEPLVPRETRAHEPRREAVDAEHYFLDLAIDPLERRLHGVARVQLGVAAERLSTLSLDLVGLEVLSVRDGAGRALRHAQRAGAVDVSFEEPLARGTRLELVIEYSGRPRGGLWFAAERDGVPTQVFTQGECEDARRWFPCFDYPADRATSELRVSIPAGWISVAAGERVESRLEGDRRIDHWRMPVPHPTYLTTLVAGELELVEEDWQGLPLWYVAEEANLEWLAPAFAETDEGLAFLEELTGRRYPYAKYSQACVAGFPFGGMENISATTMTETTLGDERSRRDSTSTGLVLHEAAHQWFGDLLTCRDWSHIWLNEGLATYATLLYFERARGVDEFRAQMRDTQDGYTSGDVGEARRPMVHAVYREPMDLFFGGQTYQGGAARLHLLRHELGDELFFAGLRRYVADNAGRGVETDDFQLAMEAASGRDLSAFFEQWFERAGYPEFEVSWSWSEEAGELRLSVEQLQEPARGTPAAFRVPVDVEVRTAAGARTHRIEVSRRRERFALPCDAAPVWVRFDEHGAVPKKLRAIKTDAEWMAIASGDDDVNGRRDALAALGAAIAEERGAAERAKLLDVVVRRLREDPSPHVRVAAARALGVGGGSEARFHLTVAATSDPGAPVRVAALEELAGYGADPALADLAGRCFEDGYSWRTMLAAAGLFARADPARAADWIRARLDLDSPHQVLRSGLIELLGTLAQPELAPQLRRLAADERRHLAVRAAALVALGRCGAGDPTTRPLLASQLRSPHIALRRAAVAALQELGDPAAVADLEAGYELAVIATERRAIEAAIESLER